MTAATTLGRLIPAFSVDGPSNIVRAAWDKLSRVPGGTRAFSRLVGFMAPYTGSMGAHVVELAQDRSRVELKDRAAVRNHLRCVHAIALANLAELTANVTVAYSLPDDARFIVAGLSIAYVKKARGTIVGSCDVHVPQDSAKCEIEVPVVMRDRNGEIVATAMLRTLIGPKQR